MFYVHTKRYLIISSFIYLYLSAFSFIFIILLFCNFIKWKNNIRGERAKKNLLKKNEIIKEEFDNELWWYRAELNIKDIYGLVIKDFNSIINYSNLLVYYNFSNCIIFNYENNIIFNNQFNFLKKKNYNKKKNLKIIENLNNNYLLNINKHNLIYSKKNVKNYLKNYYKINKFIVLNNNVNKNLNIKYINILYLRLNNNYKNNWWTWYKYINQ